MSRRDIEVALERLQQVVAEDPEDLGVWLRIADLHAAKRDLPAAIATYRRVADAHQEQGSYLKAMAIYRQILTLEPRLDEVRAQLAETYARLGLAVQA